MASGGARDARRVLDAVAQLGDVDALDALPRAAAHLLAELVQADRAGWVTVDFSLGRLDGVHWPRPIPDLLSMFPANLAEVPLVEPVLSARGTGAIRISDVWSRREWHGKRIYWELYAPTGAEHQMAAPISFGGGGAPRFEALSAVRGDRDFSAREAWMLEEFTRHVRIAARRLRAAPTPLTVEIGIERGLTERQAQAIIALADGMTTRQAAARLGVAEKTLENHAQGAYGRLGVNNRMAAIRTLAGLGAPAFALGEIPH